MTIVRDDAMDGEPRLEGRRITVLTVVNFVEDFGGVEQAAKELRINPKEVRDAVDWAREHTDKMDELREDWAEVHEEVYN